MKVFVLALTVALIGLSSARILEPLTREGVIAGKYIVKLKDGVDSRSFVNSKSLRNGDGVLAALRSSVEFTYDTAFNGFSAALDDTQLRSLDALGEVCIVYVWVTFGLNEITNQRLIVFKTCKISLFND